MSTLLTLQAGLPACHRSGGTPAHASPSLAGAHAVQKGSQEDAEIQRLIQSLAEIDHPDVGISPSMSGAAFAPIPGSEQPGAMVLTNHGLQRSNAVVELVKRGPRALPFLLNALDDATPTHLTVKREGMIMWMRFATEAWSNPANRTETEALKDLPRKDSFSLDRDRDTPNSYTIKVGDICLVLIGQIVGRPYAAVRYQPTGGIVINSPTKYPAFAKAIRRAWTAANPDQALYVSLLLDYTAKSDPAKGKHTTQAEDLDNAFRIPAAMRLLYYYPKQTAPMIAKRLERFQVQGVGPGEGSPMTDRQSEAWERREHANGVRTLSFLHAVAWCQEPRIKSAVVGIFRRTEDPDLLAASAQALSNRDAPLARTRIGSLLARQPADDGGAFGDGYNLLIALGQHGGTEAKPLFTNYLKIKSVQRIRTMAHVLREVRPEWAVGLLKPYLTDKRTFGWEYAVKPNENEPRLPIRVCDEVAETLAGTQKGLSFKMEGTHQDLDSQIARMRLALNR